MSILHYYITMHTIIMYMLTGAAAQPARAAAGLAPGRTRAFRRGAAARAAVRLAPRAVVVLTSGGAGSRLRP